MAWSHKNFIFMTNSYKYIYSTQAFNDMKPHKFMCITSNELIPKELYALDTMILVPEQLYALDTNIQ